MPDEVSGNTNGTVPPAPPARARRRGRKRRLLTRAAKVLAVILGIFAGIGLYTFTYGKGFSYFSTDPAACANCHVMQDQYASWQKAPHHASATCVECHLPHDFIPKMIAKADNGWRHSKAFTLMDFHEPIQMTPGNHKILQDNCVRCHQQFVDNLVHGSTSAPDAVSCIQCHRGIGHGARW
ncbi:MAG TPA: cytochrome c nitrite reductase small subunit [Tepidisphaeraceae bacterium]|nr:cytochrome c nitrite reductase small subunit [Tepidisphaeraceae bacterium]